MNRMLTAAAASFFLFAGCGAPEICAPTALSCENGGTIESCCSGADCRYVMSDGKEFPCESSGNCTQAASDAVAYCQGE
jgi:hypothetical protein